MSRNLCTPLGLDHIVLRVANLAAMEKFYAEALGCERFAANAAVGIVQLAAGDAVIDLAWLDGALGQRGGTPPALAGHNVDHFCLRVAPFAPAAIEEAVRLAGGTVVVSGPREQGSVYVRDPEGNIVELKAIAGG